MSHSSPVVAIVQARMSSSRLPGKVLMPIAGKPLLWHVVHRLRQCRTVDRIAIATSTDVGDDAIESFCAAEAVTCVRGSLTNVLDRYRQAAETTGAKTLLRVTGDTALLDPAFVDHLVNGLLRQNGDLAVMEPGVLCAHEGVDAFSRKALDWLVDHAAGDPIACEHVTSYFKLHPDGVKIVTVAAYPSLAVLPERLSIDTVDDLALIRLLYEKLRAPAGELKLCDALALMREDPALRRINAHVRQKAMGQVERHALICCEGGSNAGLGHVRRSLSLARALRDSHGYGVTIGLKGDFAIAELIRTDFFEVVLLDSFSDLENLAGSGKFSLAIVDVKDWLTRRDMTRLVARIPLLAVIDDISERRLAASHAYYPPVPQAVSLTWTGSTCLRHIGWEWCVLGFHPAPLTAPRTPHDEFRILVTMGGADPLKLTGLALDALRRIGAKVQADIVIGPAFANAEAIIANIGNAGPQFRAWTGISDLASLSNETDLAIIAFGVTAYELAALGVPAIYIPISADHALSASAFVAAGLGTALPERPSAEQIASAAIGLIEDKTRRQAMRETGPRIVDGQGALRIAADLAAAVETHSRSG
jgi:spore coat polysaccharide biosynthesis protein SpsF